MTIDGSFISKTNKNRPEQVIKLFRFASRDVLSMRYAQLQKVAYRTLRKTKKSDTGRVVVSEGLTIHKITMA